MTSVASSAINNANSNNRLNPFEGMRPPVCSQEDEIRKGIFGQSLRLLYTASEADKQQWRLAIEEALSAKRSKAQARGKETAEAVGIKRSREEDGESRAVQETSPVSVPTDTEFIASYLRTLLDKVIGLSLLALPAEALRVFFVILKVPLPSSRSKMALYNTLASFHYTHFEKLGKRVPTSHNLDAQQKRDADMMKKILHTRSSIPSPASSSSSPLPHASTKPHTATSTSSATAATKPSRAVGSGGAKPPSSGELSSSTTDRAGAPAQAPSGAAKEGRGGRNAAASRGNNAEMDDAGEEKLEVMYATKVFANTAKQQPLQSLQHEDEDEDEWTVGYLEKKVASVVQLYDPVTTAVVVKKLAQMGYRKPNATETVERILHSFHARELVYYDNGIAYLL